MIDVASIRENPSAGAPRTLGGVQFRPGRLQVINVSTENLVARAFGLAGKSPRLHEQLIIGWPKTGIKDRGFDITANLTTSGPLSREEQARVVLELLTTRFAFKAHTEQRPTEAYRLTLVKPGTLGLALKRVDYNCAELAPADYPKNKDGRSVCRGGNFLPGRGLVNMLGSGDIRELIADLEALTSVLTKGQDERLVVDDTGLQGFFMWEFPTTGELTTNLREWLALKFELAKVPVDVVVIDDVRMPTPN
jgi:uncharacterized protein (TIGR03435 family)